LKPGKRKNGCRIRTFCSSISLTPAATIQTKRSKKKIFLQKAAHLALTLAAFILLAHLAWPHYHNPFTGQSKSLCDHSQGKTLIHFVVKMLTANAGPDHLEDFHDSKWEEDVESYLPPGNAVLPAMPELPVFVISHLQAPMHGSSVAFTFLLRGPPVSV